MKHEITYFDVDGEVRSCQVSEEKGWLQNAGSVWNEELKLGFSWETKQENGYDVLVLPRAGFREEGARKFKDIIPATGRISGIEGDGGALVLPLDSGRLCHTRDKKPEEYYFPHFRAPEQWQVSWSNINLIGQFAGGKAKAAVLEGGSFDARLRVRTNWGVERIYSVDLVFAVRDFADDAPIDEDISIVYGEFSGDWKAMATFYRDYLLNRRKLPTLEEKQQNNPDLDYSAKAITARCRMGVKPLPWQPIQTPENEPPVDVYMTFSDITRIADEFAKQGVGEVEFCLVGWAHGGHDGAFPQLFPVEESMGGERELRKTIDHVRNLGYHISLHDNYYTGYLLADNYTEDEMCRNHDGSPAIWDDGDCLAGGIPYTICPVVAAEKHAPSNFPRCADLGINGAYFVDVISIIGMRKCYDKKHPMSRRGNALRYKQILKSQQDYFNVSMSEGSRDWALPELDRSYMVLNCIDVPFDCVDELVPLYQMIFHGMIIYNSFREGVNGMPGEELYLKNLAWGGLPMVYFHHLFHPDWKAETGWAKDLTLESPEKLTEDTARIKRMSDDINRLESLRYVPIVDIIQQGPKLSRTVYANGTSVWANYSNETIKSSCGKDIPPRDFVVIN